MLSEYPYKEPMQNYMISQTSIMDYEIWDNKMIREHFHQNIELLYILEGEIDFHMEDKSCLLKKDDFIVVNSLASHWWNTKKDILIACFHINYIMLSQYINPAKISFQCNSSIAEKEKQKGYDALRELLLQIFSRYFNKNGKGMLLLNSMYFSVLNLLVKSFMKDKFSGNEKIDSEEERINEILTYVHANYHKQIRLKDLAEHLYLSSAYLSKYIKKRLGMNFLEYVNSIRLSHALTDLQKQDKTMTYVALQNGFPNVASFNNVFKSTYGKTPKQYIKNNKYLEDYAITGETNPNNISNKIKKFLKKQSVQNDFTKADVLEIYGDANANRLYVKSWCQMLNVGNISSLEGAAMQEHVTILKQELKIRYARIRGLFGRELLFTENGNRTYNYDKCLQLIDFLEKQGLHPYFDVGFKPIATIGPKGEYVLVEEPEIIFHNDEEFAGFFSELLPRCVRYFGMEAVEEWYFDIWMDPKITSEDYFDLYRKIYHAIKNISPKIKVGGAGYEYARVSNRISDIFLDWKQQTCKPDFISVHSYPYEDGEHVNAEGHNIAKEIAFRKYWAQIVRDAMFSAGFSVAEFHMSEWNLSVSFQNFLNDSSYKGAYVLKNIQDNIGLVDIMGYWHGTDLCTMDNTDHIDILNGKGGLISKDGIRKPAFWAIQFMNGHYPYILTKTEESMITSDGLNGYYITCCNYKHPNFLYYLKEEATIDKENINEFFDDTSSMKIKFIIRNVWNGRYTIRCRSISQASGDPITNVLELGIESGLDENEKNYLRAVCAPKMATKVLEVTDGIITLEAVLLAHEIQGISIVHKPDGRK